MKFAIVDNLKTEAYTGLSGKCELCMQKVIAKCGDINIHHWAHKRNKDCDLWNEPETQWHRDWKNNFPVEFQEVIIKNHRADIKTKNGTVIEIQNSPISSKKISDRECFYSKMIWILNGETFLKNINFKNKGNYYTFRWKSPRKTWWHSNEQIYIDCSPHIKNLKKQIKKMEEDENFNRKSLIGDVTIYYGDYYEYYNEYAELIEVDNTREYNISLHIRQMKEKLNLMNNSLFLIKKIHKKIPCYGWGIFVDKNKFINNYR